jgi:hypothetical protein
VWYETLVGIALYGGMIFGSWFFPRKLGFGGLVLAQAIIVVVMIIMNLFDLSRGVVEDPDFIYFFGTIFWTLVCNVVLLPVSILALFRRRKALAT